jgi:alpha-ketoglutarate-dependent taurine dioxygenase
VPPPRTVARSYSAIRPYNIGCWYPQRNFLWHIDGATDWLPQQATLLTAREADPAGGGTEFASTYAAYEALPDTQKARIAGLRVVHNFGGAGTCPSRRQRGGAGEVGPRAEPGAPARVDPP